MSIVPASMARIKKAGYTLPFIIAYAALSDRDKIALRTLALFLFSLLFVYGLWIPSSDFRAAAEREFLAQAELFTWMRENEESARRARRYVASASGAPATEAMLSLIDSSAKTHAIDLQRYEPKPGNEVSLWLENVQFNSLITWLEDLTDSQRIQVVQVDIDRKGNGAVDARIDLRR